VNLSNLSMFSEVKCSFQDSFDSFDELVKPEEWNLSRTDENKDEYLIKPKSPNPTEDWEMRLFRAKRFVFNMNSCTNYENFVEVLESTLIRFSSYLTPADITAMGVHGYYLYPVSSLQEFSQLVFAWSDNYLNSEDTQVEISDLGVDVTFQKESLKINIVCKLLAKNEVKKYFPVADTHDFQEANLFIHIQASTNEPLKVQKSLSAALSQTIKTHVYQATKLIEQRLEKLHTK
jgi:hypothetical protein